MFQYMCNIFRENNDSFKNQMLMVSCYLQGYSVCSSFVFDAD